MKGHALFFDLFPVMIKVREIPAIKAVDDSAHQEEEQEHREEHDQGKQQRGEVF